eukprot:TRINITY_DN6042_c0_g1_i1.p1 TRINITY_DN6042_c0_g1~~TRINITY_DN6042_c0_g1_i1.p1  ORF type:complete len:107 (-),score=15.09 TRINITY_DN6042_c0_g1_i1:186-506(-)
MLYVYCFIIVFLFFSFFFFQAEDGIRDLVRSRGLGDVYKRQVHSGCVRAEFFVFLDDDHCDLHSTELGQVIRLLEQSTLPFTERNLPDAIVLEVLNVNLASSHIVC